MWYVAIVRKSILKLFFKLHDAELWVHTESVAMDCMYANERVNSILIYNFFKSGKKELHGSPVMIPNPYCSSADQFIVLCGFIPSDTALVDPLWKGPNGLLMNGVEDCLVQTGAVNPRQAL